MTPTRPCRLLLAACLAPAAAGCSEELGPVRFEATRVEGRVTVEGRPALAGFIEFGPGEGTVGTIRSAPIGADGRFAVDGVPLGVSRVGIAHSRFGEVASRLGPVASFEFEPLRTPIRRDIDRTPVTRLDLDLGDEALALRRRRITPR